MEILEGSQDKNRIKCYTFILYILSIQRGVSGILTPMNIYQASAKTVYGLRRARGKSLQTTKVY